jgi:hypothetical protein
VKKSLLATLFKGTILNSPTRLEKLARKTGWMQRTPKKLKPIAFIHGILQAASKGEASFRLLATAIGMRLENKVSVPESENSYDTLSKQALWERVDESAVDFFKASFEEQLKSKGLTDHSIPSLPSIRRIIVEDSSKIDLPDHLADKFPASRNHTEHEGAGLRLQGAFDLIGGEVIRLELTEYYRQDTTASADILPLLQPNDLALRDLGYLVSDTLNQIMERGAHFLSRYKTGRPLYHCEEKGGEEINLIKYLKKHAPYCGDSIDLGVAMGCPQSRTAPQVKCRLVAVRLPAEVVEKRLRQVNKEDKRRGRQRSEESKQLLGWTVLITSLPSEEADVELLMELYPLRWRVEIIFKSLKSYTPGMALANHRSNANHIQVLLYAWLCLTVAATKLGVFALAKKSNGKNSVLKPNLLSLLKVMPKVFEMFRMALYFCSSPSPAELLDRWLTQCEYHDQYEKRNKRTNMAEMTASALGFDDVDDSIGSELLSLP